MTAAALLFALIAAFHGTANGFAPPRPSTFSRSISPSEPTRLSAIDPAHLSDAVSSSLSLLADSADAAAAATAPAGEVAQSTYSRASYYTTLGLYALSFPGIWSQIKRSTSAKVKRKTYVRCDE